MDVGEIYVKNHTTSSSKVKVNLNNPNLERDKLSDDMLECHRLLIKRFFFV